MGFLGTTASSFADISLIAEAIGFLLLLAGVVYIKKKDFLRHDETARIAVILASISFTWMWYSLVSNFNAFISTTGLLIITHSISGIIALSLGVFLVLNEVKKTKTSMLVVMILWTVAVSLGIVLYSFYMS